MATSQISIVNIALSRLRIATINSLDDASEEARQARLHWDVARDAVLREYDWNFARRRKALALYDAEPIGWTYAYAYPSDCVKARRLLTADGALDPNGLPYEFEAGRTEDGSHRAIMCDIEECVLEYTCRADVASEYDALFVDALAWRLGAEISMTLRGEASAWNAAMQSYGLALGRAMACDANEGFVRNDNAGDLVNCRI
jgi:hypothetical protein